MAGLLQPAITAPSPCCLRESFKLSAGWELGLTWL